MILQFNNISCGDGTITNFIANFANPETRRIIKALNTNPDLLKCLMVNLMHYEAYADDETIAISPETESILKKFM